MVGCTAGKRCHGGRLLQWQLRDGVDTDATVDLVPLLKMSSRRGLPACGVARIELCGARCRLAQDLMRD